MIITFLPTYLTILYQKDIKKIQKELATILGSFISKKQTISKTLCIINATFVLIAKIRRYK